MKRNQITLRRRATATMALGAALVTAAPLRAQPATIRLVSGPGYLATALSADGGTVVGHDLTGTPFRWTSAGGVELLGSVPRSPPIGVSADGAVVLGTSWRWTQVAGFEEFSNVAAAGMTADGLMAVGFDQTLGNELCPWPFSQPRALPEYTARRQARPGGAWHHVPGAPNNVITKAGGISADGLTVVGSTWAPQCWFPSPPSIACFWRNSSQVILSGAALGSHATGASSDGAVIVGSPGFRWTAAGGMQGLWGGTAFSSAGGDVVVGTAGAGGSAESALIWDQSHGVRDLPTVLATLGIPLPPFLGHSCDGVSADGRTVLITGRAFANYRYACLAFLGDPVPYCHANCDGSTAAPVLNVNDFTCFLSRFASGDPWANCDASTAPPIFNINDFTCFLNSFAGGCP